MKRFFLSMALIATSLGVFAQTGKEAQNETIPVLWEELTSPDFKKAVELSGGVCIIPMGVLEKHGPHLPLSTDVIVAKGISVRAAAQEYAVVFPGYYFGQINEAMQQPGTLSYSPELLYKILDETCAEIARNGLKKIILYSYHGGNNNFLAYFCQSQLYKKKDYVVYFAKHKTPKEVDKQIDKMIVNSRGGHADETESSSVMYLRPELVKISHANDESGEALKRLPLKNLFTGIWWYADYPNHYSGNAIAARPELGELLIKDRVDVLVEMIKAVKADSTASALQNEFYERAANPCK